MVPVKSYDFSRPLVKKRVVWLNRNHFCSGWTHFYHNEVTYERLCDGSVVESRNCDGFEMYARVVVMDEHEISFLHSSIKPQRSFFLQENFSQHARDSLVASYHLVTSLLHACLHFRQYSGSQYFCLLFVKLSIVNWNWLTFNLLTRRESQSMFEGQMTQWIVPSIRNACKDFWINSYTRSPPRKVLADKSAVWSDWRTTYLTVARETRWMRDGRRVFWSIGWPQGPDNWTDVPLDRSLSLIVVTDSIDQLPE